MERVTIKEFIEIWGKAGLLKKAEGVLMRLPDGQLVLTFRGVAGYPEKNQVSEELKRKLAESLGRIIQQCEQPPA